MLLRSGSSISRASNSAMRFFAASSAYSNSSTVAGLAWSGAYAPASKETRAALMVERIEAHNSPGSLAYCEQRDRFEMQLQLAV